MWVIRAIIRDEGDVLPAERIDIECELEDEVPLRLGILLMELLPEIEDGASFTVTINDSDGAVAYRLNGGQSELSVLGQPSSHWRIRSNVWPVEVECDYEEDVAPSMGIFAAQTLPRVVTGAEFTIAAIRPEGRAAYIIVGEAAKAFLFRDVDTDVDEEDD